MFLSLVIPWELLLFYYHLTLLLLTALRSAYFVVLICQKTCLKRCFNQARKTLSQVSQRESAGEEFFSAPPAQCLPVRLCPQWLLSTPPCWKPSTAQAVELPRDDIARATAIVNQATAIVIHEQRASLACSVNGQTEQLPQPLRFRA